jgi:hypothetical protein
MKKIYASTLLLTALGLAILPVALRAQGSYEIVTGKAFDSAMVKDFYLEGNAIPAEKRNAALLKTPAGSRVLLALIDTAGYSSQVQQKYEGMIISEGNFTVCGLKVGVGSFGFGHTKPAATSNEDMQLALYDQAGAKLGECAGKKDAAMTQPKPLQVVTGKGQAAKLYLGRYAFELR